jgi:predicted nucleic acid-binding protein
METVIETSMWVDFFRPKTPPGVKDQIKPWVLRHDVALCEPVACELLRSAAARERGWIQRHFATIPMLRTPAALWTEATQLGQRCHDAGVMVGALDLLIATVCVHHGAMLITFDEHFAEIAKRSRLQAKILPRAS